MPGKDRTGPRGDGPMTGRGAGNCAGNAIQNGAKFGPRRRLGARFGWGGSSRRRFRFRGTGMRGRGWFKHNPVAREKLDE